MKTIKLIIIGLVACFTLQAQNIMQLSSVYLTDELDCEIVYAAINQATVDTLFKYKANITDNNHTKITEVVNDDLNDLLTKVLKRQFDGLTPTHIAFAQLILFHKADIPELAVRLHNQSLIDNDNYDYTTGDNVSGWDVNRHEWTSGVIIALPEHTDQGNMIIRKNRTLRELNQYTIFE